MRGPLMMIVLVSGPLTPLGNDNTDNTDNISHQASDHRDWPQIETNYELKKAVNLSET